MIAGSYRGQAAAGRVEALVELGDLLYDWDDRQAAGAAYQEAVDAGHLPALLGLAQVLRGTGAEDAGVAAYQRAISSGDPDLAAQATYELARLHVSRRDADAARALFEQLIATGHPEWAAPAMLGLARLQQVIPLRWRRCTGVPSRPATTTGPAARPWRSPGCWNAAGMWQGRPPCCGS